jgi:hypothetical protein
MEEGEGPPVEQKETFSPDEEREQYEAFFREGVVGETPATDFLDVMKNYVIQHSRTLNKMRENLSESVSMAWTEENNCINIDMTPRDPQHVAHMIKTDNQQFNKVTTVLSYLVAEMLEMVETAEKTFYGPLLMFGHDAKKNLEPAMGMFIPMLQELCNFVSRAKKVARNTVNQLACLNHEKQKLFLTTFAHVRLTSVFEALGQLSRVLITLDTLLADNQRLHEAWTAYKNMVKYIRSDPSRFNQTADKLQMFEGCMLQIEKEIIAAHTFEDFCCQDYGLPGTANEQTKVLLAGNRVLNEQFEFMIKALITKISTGKV